MLVEGLLIPVAFALKPRNLAIREGKKRLSLKVTHGHQTSK